MTRLICTVPAQLLIILNSARAVTRHFGHYNRYYVLTCTPPPSPVVRGMAKTSRLYTTPNAVDMHRVKQTGISKTTSRATQTKSATNR